MKEEIKNSIKASFVNEPSVDFTSAVMQRIEAEKKAKSSTKEPVSLWVYVILFCIVGAPICLIVGYAIFQNFTFTIPEVSLPTFEISQQWNIGQFFVDALPYTLFLLVFCGIVFMNRLRDLWNSNLNKV